MLFKSFAFLFFYLFNLLIFCFNLAFTPKQNDEENEELHKQQEAQIMEEGKKMSKNGNVEGKIDFVNRK